MKTIVFLLVLLAAWAGRSQNMTQPFLQGQSRTVLLSTGQGKPGTVDLSPELAQVTADLKKTFDAGKIGGTNFNGNLNAITGLIRDHYKEGKREQVARLYLLVAHIYADGLTNSVKARAIWNQVVRDYPGTVAAQGAALSLARAAAFDDAAIAAIPEGLEVGQRFPDFSKQDANGSPLSVSAYRGRVTMIDFWATWCGPCKAEMPNVIATRQRFASQGFAIIGVSLDSDRDALAGFTQAHGMDWVQYFDGKGWENELAVKYGVHSIPMDYLLDRRGVIIGKELRGEALGNAVMQALAN